MSVEYSGFNPKSIEEVLVELTNRLKAIETAVNKEIIFQIRTALTIYSQAIHDLEEEKFSQCSRKTVLNLIEEANNCLDVVPTYLDKFTNQLGREANWRKLVKESADYVKSVEEKMKRNQIKSDEYKQILEVVTQYSNRLNNIPRSITNDSFREVKNDISKLTLALFIRISPNDTNFDSEEIESNEAVVVEENFYQKNTNFSKEEENYAGIFDSVNAINVNDLTINLKLENLQAFESRLKMNEQVAEDDEETFNSLLHVNVKNTPLTAPQHERFSSSFYNDHAPSSKTQSKSLNYNQNERTFDLEEKLTDTTTTSVNHFVFSVPDNLKSNLPNIKELLDIYNLEVQNFEYPVTSTEYQHKVHDINELMTEIETLPHTNENERLKYTLSVVLNKLYQRACRNEAIDSSKSSNVDNTKTYNIKRKPSLTKDHFKSDDVDFIKAIRREAKTLEEKIRNSKYTNNPGYHQINANLINLLENLDKIKWQNNKALLDEKVKTIQYITELMGQLEINIVNSNSDTVDCNKETKRHILDDLVRSNSIGSELVNTIDETEYIQNSDVNETNEDFMYSSKKILE